MYDMRKNKIKVFILIISICSIFFSPIFILDTTNNSEANFSILISRNFKNLNTKQSSFEFYIPENYTLANSQFNIQPYSTYITFNPEPDNKYFDTDRFQNKLVKFTYKSIYGFSVNIRFTGSLISKNNKILFIPYPYNEKDISSSLYIYLEQSYDPIIMEFASEMSKNKSNLINILLNIKNYIDNNIEIVPEFKSRNPNEIIKNKIASREELLDFYAVVLRILGIPVRISCGLGLPQKYLLKQENKINNFEIYSGKGVITFIEVWTSDYGWVFFDPFFSFLSSLNNIIKLGHAQYSNQLHYIYVESKSLNISMEESYKVDYSKNDNFNFSKIIDNLLDYFFILPETIYDFSLTNFEKSNTNSYKEYYSGYKDRKNKEIQFIGFETKNEIDISEKSILQSFYLSEDYIIKELLINSFLVNAKFNVEIYKGNDINNKYLIYHSIIDPGNRSIYDNDRIKIIIPSIYFKKGIYTIHIFVAEPDKNCIFLANEISGLPNFPQMILLKDNLKIKTNLIFPLILKYE